MADRDEKELTEWVKKHFSNLSEEAFQGIEVLVRALWANTQVTKKLWVS